MLKYDLVEILRPLIIEALATLGLTDFEVLDHNQFTKQQLENHTITFQIINDKKIGFRQSQNILYPELKQKYTQKKEIIFQLMCFLKEDIEDLTLTSNDILSRVALFFTTENILIALNVNNIGFARESEVREIPIRDAGENYIICSSIDLILVTDDSFEIGIKEIEQVNQTLKRI